MREGMVCMFIGWEGRGDKATELVREGGFDCELGVDPISWMRLETGGGG